jgi:hypothetical protein
VNAVVDLYVRAGRRVEAFRLAGKPPEERALALWATLRDRGVHAREAVAVWLAVEATIHADPQAERKTEFKRVQAGKVLHRMAGGTHKRWERPSSRGGTIATKLDKHMHSRGRVLRHIGEQLEQSAHVVANSFVSVRLGPAMSP